MMRLDYRSAVIIKLQRRWAVLNHYKVFLDSNIYDGMNYSFGNPQFKKLKELANAGHVTLLINSVVIGEVKKHIRERLKKAAKEYNGIVTSREFAAFRYEDLYASKFEKINTNEMYELCQKRFDEYLKDSNAVIIPVNGIDVEQIISDYVNENYPFESSKPEEFKDAIILQSILQYRKGLDSEEVISVITNDKGVRAAIAKTNNLAYEDINKFLDRVTKDIDLQTRVLNEYLNTDNARDAIEEQIYSFINNVNYNLGVPYDEFDVLEISSVDFDISFIDIISPEEANVVVGFSAEIKVWFTYVDEDNSYFDKEDWEYLWKEEVEKEETHTISFEMSINIDVSEFKVNEDEEELEVEDYILSITGYKKEQNRIELNENTFIEGEVIAKSNRYEEQELKGAYTSCPDCGCSINLENDGGNGFCIECAPNH